MPARVIRESLLDSPRYAACTIPQQLLFLHLLLLADDYGCLEASPTFILRRAFAGNLSRKRPAPERLLAWLAALEAAGLIACYDHGAARFLFIPRFRQRLRAMRLRCPIPPRAVLEQDPEALRRFELIAHEHPRAIAPALEKQRELPILAPVPQAAAAQPAPVAQVAGFDETRLARRWKEMRDKANTIRRARKDASGIK